MVNGVLLFVYFSSIRIKNCIYASHCFYYKRLSKRRNEYYLLLNSCEGRSRRGLVTVGRTVRRTVRRAVAVAVAVAKRVRTTRVQNWRTSARERARNGCAGRFGNGCECAGRCAWEGACAKSTRTVILQKRTSPRDYSRANGLATSIMLQARILRHLSHGGSNAFRVRTQTSPVPVQIR